MPGKASFPAYWLYLGDTPVVHLDGLRVAYTTNEIPAFGLNQIFLVDPAGLRDRTEFLLRRPDALTFLRAAQAPGSAQASTSTRSRASFRVWMRHSPSVRW